MRVTAVVPLDKRRSKVLLDQDFAFVLYTGERRRYRIEEGAELSEETWREIRDQVLAGRAKERALYLLERCGRTEREIAQKLQEGMYPPEVIRDTLEGLKRLCLLDDEQYGRQYIDAYREKRSRKRLCRDLQQKGLSPELIRRLLEEEPVDEDRQIRTFLQKKGYDRETWTRQEKGKLAAALARKGFSWEAVYRMLGGDGEDGDF